MTIEEEENINKLDKVLASSIQGENVGSKRIDKHFNRCLISSLQLLLEVLQVLKKNMQVLKKR